MSQIEGNGLWQPDIYPQYIDLLIWVKIFLSSPGKV